MKLTCQRFAPCLVDSVGLALKSEKGCRGDSGDSKEK
jgi:hypothetical protein